MIPKIAVLGSGSWGSALSKLLAEKEFDVLMWAYEEEVRDGINSKHRNPLYLRDIKLPKTIKATSDLKEAVLGREIVVSALPSHALRNIVSKAGPHISKNALVISCTKGIEIESLKLMSDVLAEILGSHPKENFTVLSGPSFAKEVAEGLPTSVVIAGKDQKVSSIVQDIFRTSRFLTFTSNDIVGVEVGGAVKNVVAIVAGISDALGFGHNTRATIITRGLYEMIKIGRALGANPMTFSGLSGIGDLVLTCTANLSRNYTVGKMIGEGKKLEQIKKSMKMVAEGVPTTSAVHKLSAKFSLNTPICGALHAILFEGLGPKIAVEQLCKMQLKEELGSIMKQKA